MNISRTRDFVNQYGALILITLAVVLLHFLTNNQYGFHRDELPLFDDALDLDWGYVAYPPVTPLITRIAIELFGTSLAAIHVIPTLVQGFTLIIIGLMARELGGGRMAQIMTMIAIITSGRVLSMGGRMDYVTFDYLWWVLVAYFILRLLNSENPRWWLAIGAVIGLGMMTKYTMAVWAVALVGGVLLTETRHYLKSPYLWSGAGLSLLIFLPNLLWQLDHDFISLDFLSSIHERDIEWGRTDGFLPEQFLICTNPPTVPFWIAGLYFYFFRPEGRKYRLLGWMYVIAFVLLFAMRGRSYYLVGAYPPLMAAGMVLFEKMVNSLSVPKARIAKGTAWIALAIGAAIVLPLALPIAPINSDLWDVTADMHDGFIEEIGWHDLTDTVAEIYTALPTEEQSETAILAANYGEAGALHYYGPSHDLPDAISGINSYWLRGYGDEIPEQLIILGYQREDVESAFENCELVGRVTNRDGVENEETQDHPDIFLCRNPRKPWQELWEDIQGFG